MSFFGKNIKKIRKIKSLSQQAFADIFDLKRGTLGAYEEGRSEPKIDTLVRVASHFSISIDQLLTRELTVNELLQFKEDLTLNSTKAKIVRFAVVPCITEDLTTDYIRNFDKPGFVRDLPSMQLPINPEKEFRGYTVVSLEMTDHDRGYYPKDVVIGERVPKDVVKKLNAGTLVLVVVEDKLIFRRLYVTNSTAVLRADHKNIDDYIYALNDLKEVWRVRYTFFRRLPDFGDDVEDKLEVLEQELLRIRERLK